MNTKTLNLYLPPTSTSLPIYLSGFTPSITVSGSMTYVLLRAELDGGETTNLIKTVPVNNANLILNPSFENGSSASVVTSWDFDYPIWSRQQTNNSYAGSYCATTSLTPGISGSITSASFDVTGGQKYIGLFHLFSKNGSFYYGDVSGIFKGEFEADYQIKINWFNNTTLLSSEVLTSGSGNTTESHSLDASTNFELEYDISQNVLENGTISSVVSDSLLGTTSNEFAYTSSNTADIFDTTGIAFKSNPFWVGYLLTTKAPNSANKAKIVIEASCQNFNGSMMFSASPIIYVDDFYFYTPTNKIKIYPQISFSDTTTFSAEFEDTILPDGVNTLTFSASAVSGSTTDCTGHEPSYFDSTGVEMVLGNKGKVAWKSWIPFTINFGTPDKAIKVQSAYLYVVSSSDRSFSADKDCNINVGFDKTINSLVPSSWDTLNGKAMTNNPYSGSIVEAWTTGLTYSFNVTNSAKALFGNQGITWNNNNKADILITDNGSNENTYRTIVTTEGIEAPPILKITYSNVRYTDEVVDTFICHNLSTDPDYESVDNVNYYPSKTIPVGVPMNNARYPLRRGLLFFDVSSLSTSASVNYATLGLYHESSQSNESVNQEIRFYQMRKPWDAYTATWNRQHGLKDWTAAGGFDSADCNPTYSGSIALSSSETVGWKTLTIKASDVQDWVTSASTNCGLLFKMTDEDYNYKSGHTFTSSAGDTISRHPYLDINYTSGSVTKTTRFQT